MSGLKKAARFDGPLAWPSLKSPSPRPSADGRGRLASGVYFVFADSTSASKTRTRRQFGLFSLMNCSCAGACW